MQSMTGFGSASRSTAEGRITIEVRGVNHRFLDAHIRLPREMAAAETAIRDSVRKRIRRGRVDVTVWWVPAVDPAVDALDPERLRPLKEALEHAARSLDLDEGVSLDALLRVREQGGPTAQPMEEARCTSLVNRPLREALASFVAMRQREGERLVVDANKILTTLEKHVARVARRAPRIVDEQGRRLRARVAELLGEAELDPERIAQEVAVLADRMDVREETTRLESHLDQARSVLASGKEGGRKLDFLVQEMLRETNTIGSKLAGKDATREVVAMKAAIEKLREQIQNLE